jgi:hypothetical protein
MPLTLKNLGSFFLFPRNDSKRFSCHTGRSASDRNRQNPSLALSALRSHHQDSYVAQPPASAGGGSSEWPPRSPFRAIPMPPTFPIGRRPIAIGTDRNRRNLPRGFGFSLYDFELVSYFEFRILCFPPQRAIRFSSRLRPRITLRFSPPRSIRVAIFFCGGAAGESYGRRRDADKGEGAVAGPGLSV